VALLRFLLPVALCLMPCPLQGASLSFGEALRLALSRNVGVGPISPAPPANATPAPRLANSSSCPVLLQDYREIAARLESANELTALPASRFLNSYALPSSAGPFNLQSRKDVILCASLVYAMLEEIEAQKLVLREQQSFVDRLFDIESRRVSAEVDHPLSLTQAKLMRAKIRMISEALHDSERDARTGLSALTRVPIEDTDPVAGSVPLLPGTVTTAIEDNRTLQLLVAYRDVVQLDYVSACMNRLKVTHDMALAKASIGDLVAAHIEEGMRMISLLYANGHLRAAKIQILAASGRLESWALGAGTLDAGPSAAAGDGPDQGTSSAPDPEAPGAKPAALLSLLLAPAVKELEVGKSQQYSAIATYSDGTAKDITSDARWSCSSDTSAILSSTGLLTGISAGQVTVRVEFQGVERSRKLSLTAGTADPYLPAKR